jgi:hypothetical protein
LLPLQSAVGEDQVVDAVVPESTPSDEMIDVRSPPDDLAAIETSSIGKVAKALGNRAKADAVGAEQESLQVNPMVSNVVGGELRHALCPTTLNQRPQQRSESNEAVDRTRKNDNAVGKVGLALPRPCCSTRRNLVDERRVIQGHDLQSAQAILIQNRLDPPR